MTSKRNRKAPKDKEHALACKKSAGAKSRLSNFKSYCKDTGYMGLMCLKPTWTRGKPRAFKSRNWTGPVLVPKEKGTIGEGDREMIEFSNLESDTEEEGGPGAEGDYDNYYGSPRTRRPQGELNKKKKKKGGKNKSLPPRRCHACGEVFMEEEKAKWISCGGPGEKQKGCLWMAHIRCWCLQIPPNQLEDFCDRIVRCTMCQDIEEDLDVENSGYEGQEEEGELDGREQEEQGQETDSDTDGKEKEKRSSKSPRPGPSRNKFGSHNKKSSRVSHGPQKSNSQRNGGYSSSNDFQD